MKINPKVISELYEVICDEGNVTFDDFKKAQEKIKRINQSEAFGYLVKKELDKEGKILSETLIG